MALAVIPVAAASSWWVRAPAGRLAISAVATDQGSSTLAISQGVPGWYVPTSGSFRPISAPGGGPGSAAALAVAALGRVGVVAYRGGSLLEVIAGGPSQQLPPVAGVARALALLPGTPGFLAVGTSQGLFSGRLGSRLSQAAKGGTEAVIGPPHAGLPGLALVRGRLWVSQGRGGWARAPGAPRFDRDTRALAELSDGVVLVAEPGGLVWRGAGRKWTLAFQLLPSGGLAGVPQATALAADGVSSAYLATDGFGTLLTPDGGYTWYRAAPAADSISSLATVGPVFATRAHGLVVAVSSRAVFLHRLQALPAPPAYSPSGQTAELLGTAAVTVISALLAALAVWAITRRQPRLSV